MLVRAQITHQPAITRVAEHGGADARRIQIAEVQIDERLPRWRLADFPGAHRQVLATDVGDQRIPVGTLTGRGRSEEHTSELQSLMWRWYAVFCFQNTNLSIRITPISSSHSDK